MLSAFWSELRYRLRAILRRDAVERDLNDELRFHIEREAEKYRAQGFAREEAFRRARKAFGGREQIKEECREVGLVNLIEDGWKDLRHGARGLRRSPGFAVVALLTLALGIGATTALFSVVDRVLMHPAPWPEAERIAIIGWDFGSGNLTGGLTPAKADYWKRHTRSFETFAISDETHFVLTGEGEPEQLNAELVSDGYFRVIGMAPAIGRTFTPDENVPGGPPVVILNDALWRRSFGADPGIVGRTITLDDEPHTVIGVMPPDFEHGAAARHFAGGSADVLAPLRLEVDPRSQGHNYFSFGRLAAGVTLDRLEAETAEFTRQFDRAYPGVVEEDDALDRKSVV